MALFNRQRQIHQNQLEKSIKDPSYAHWRVAFTYRSDYDPIKFRGLTQCSVRYFLGEYAPNIDDSANNHLTTPDCCIKGSCNGLLCILKSLFLWNPTTRISTELPKLDSQYSYIGKYGFGVDEGSGAYKLFVVLSKHEYKFEGCIGKVYSSETNSWKTVEHGCLQLEGDFGVVVGRKLHWVMEGGEYIESFDLSSEVFDTIELPYKNDVRGYHVLGEARGMLRVKVTSYCYVSTKRVQNEWVRVTKGGAKEHWVEVKTKRDGLCGQIVYVESLVWPLRLKNH